MEDDVLTINKTKYKFIKTRSVEKIKRITVKRDNFGDFYFVFCCDMVIEKFKRVGDATIGMYDKLTSTYFGTIFVVCVITNILKFNYNENTIITNQD